MSYEDEFDAPTGAEEVADFRAWRAARDAEAKARQPQVIDYDGPSPAERAQAAFDAHIQAGGAEDSGLALMFDTLTAAAMAGDVRAQANPKV